eukprot:scaffold18161_cov56-Attheya_sp.AAC.6
MHCMVGYNVTDEHWDSDFQIGGTAQICINQAAHRVVSSGRDPSNLGRWVWTRMIGKGGLHFRVVMLYRPCAQNTGTSTAYAQHQHYFDSITATPEEEATVNQAIGEDATPAKKAEFRTKLRNMGPRECLLLDLEREIELWLELGDRVVVMVMMGDFNEDIRGPTIMEFFEKMGMRNLFLDMQGQDMPGTHARGSLPIDGIFGTAGLKPTACGCTPFDHGIGGNHRLVWIEFTYVNAFSHRLPALGRPVGQRLKLNDLRVKKSFRLHREKFAKQHNLRKQMFSVESDASYPPSQVEQAKFQGLDPLLVKSIQYADKRCRKIRSGALSSSPVLRQAELRVYLIQGLFKRRKRLQISSRYLQ